MMAPTQRQRQNVNSKKDQKKFNGKNVPKWVLRTIEQWSQNALSSMLIISRMKNFAGRKTRSIPSFTLAAKRPSNSFCRRDFVPLSGVTSRTAMRPSISGSPLVLFLSILGFDMFAPKHGRFEQQNSIEIIKYHYFLLKRIRNLTLTFVNEKNRFSEIRFVHSQKLENIWNWKRTELIFCSCWSIKVIFEFLLKYPAHIFLYEPKIVRWNST